MHKVSRVPELRHTGPPTGKRSNHTSRSVETHVAVVRGPVQNGPQWLDIGDSLPDYIHIPDSWNGNSTNNARSTSQELESSSSAIKQLLLLPGKAQSTNLSATSLHNIAPITREDPAAQHRAAKQLLHDIKTTTSWQQLADIYNNRSHACNPIHLVCILTHLANIAPTSVTSPTHPSHIPFSHFTNTLLHICTSHFPRLKSKSKSNLFWATCQLHPCLSHANLRSVILLTESALPTLPPHDLAAAAWCVATTSLPVASISPSWTSTFFTTTLPLLPSFTPQNLANTIWALAILSTPPPADWLHAFYACALTTLPSWHPNHYANITWSLARLSRTPSAPFLSSLISTLTPHLPSFSPTHFTDLLTALSAWPTPLPPATTAAILAHAESSLPSLPPWRTTDLLSALSTLAPLLSTPVPETLLQRTLSKVHAESRTFPPAALSILLTSLNTLTCRPPPSWMKDVLQRVPWDPHPPEHLADLLRSIAQLNYRPSRSWTFALLNHITPALPTFTNETLVTLALSCSQLDCDPSPEFVTAYFRELSARCSRLAPQGATTSNTPADAAATTQDTDAGIQQQQGRVTTLRSRLASRRRVRKRVSLGIIDVATAVSHLAHLLPSEHAAACLRPTLQYAMAHVDEFSGRICATVLRAAAEASVAVAADVGGAAVLDAAELKTLVATTQRLAAGMRTEDLCICIGSLARIAPAVPHMRAQVSQLLVDRLARATVGAASLPDTIELLVLAAAPALKLRLPAQLVRAAVELCMVELDAAEPSMLLQLLRSCHHQGYDFGRGGVAEVIIEELLDRSRRLHREEVVELLHVCGELEIRLSHDTLKALCFTLKPHAPHLHPSESARLLWAFGRLGSLPNPTLSAQLLATFLRPFHPTDATQAPAEASPATSQEAAKILWALAITSQQPSSQSLQTLTTIYTNHLPALKPSVLVDGLWGAYKLGHTPPTASLHAAFATTAPALHKLSSGALARLLFVASACGGEEVPALAIGMEQVVGALLERAPRVSGQAASAMLNTMAVLKGRYDGRRLRVLRGVVEAHSQEGWAWRALDVLDELQAAGRVVG